jgi:hypothetical protein
MLLPDKLVYQNPGSSNPGTKPDKLEYVPTLEPEARLARPIIEDNL